MHDQVSFGGAMLHVVGYAVGLVFVGMGIGIFAEHPTPLRAALATIAFAPGAYITTQAHKLGLVANTTGLWPVRWTALAP